MRVYLDNCCFNRPFDNQTRIRIKLETDAKLFVQSMIQEGKIELGWSYILDFENEANPFEERKTAIEKWKQIAVKDVEETEAILTIALDLYEKGLKPKDALHIACATEAKCEYFVTTDDYIIKKMEGRREIFVLNPTDFVKILEEK